jgi:integrase
MPKPRSSQLESPTGRRKLAVAKKPYWAKIAPGIALGYRRNEGAGTWSLRASDGHGHEWLKRIALADDLEPAAPPAVLTYWQALEAARKLARRQPGDPADETRPATVDEALDAYAADLTSRGANAYNAGWARHHLSGALLAKPVALLSATDLRRWRDGLTAKGLAPATVNRVRNAVRAALELTAKHDRQISNQGEWRTGLEGLPDAQEARNVVLDDATVLRLIEVAYQHGQHLGLLVDVLAVTGTRPSQAARLRVEDLRLDPVKPTLMVPKSGKGGSRNRVARKAQRYPVPITPALMVQLGQHAGGRSGDAPLLTRDGDHGWGQDPHLHYRRPFAEVVAAAGLDPATVTIYALRHSSIVRGLLANTPIRVVAANHDTSVRMIEAHYSRFISQHSDELSRKALLQTVPPATNVVSIAGR